MSVTAAKWVDSWARLQFRFFLNLFSCLLTTNLSQTNNRSRAGPQTLSKERQQTVNPHYIPRLFTISCYHLRCSLDRDRMLMTRFSFYDYDATQSECAHRLSKSYGWSLNKNNPLHLRKVNNGWTYNDYCISSTNIFDRNLGLLCMLIRGNMLATDRTTVSLWRCMVNLTDYQTVTLKHTRKDI